MVMCLATPQAQACEVPLASEMCLLREKMIVLARAPIFSLMDGMVM